MGGNLRGGGGFKVITSGWGSGISNGVATRDITIPAVDLTKCIVRLRGVSNAGGATTDNSLLLIRLLNSTTVRVERTGSGGDIEFSWEVIEFTGAKVIQSGYVTTASANSHTQTISTVNLNKVMAYVTHRYIGISGSGFEASLNYHTFLNATGLLFWWRITGVVAFQYYIVEYT